MVLMVDKLLVPIGTAGIVEYLVEVVASGTFSTDTRVKTNKVLEMLCVDGIVL